MPSLLKSTNLFPYMKFWRMRGHQEINHTLGGVCSIIIYAVVLAIIVLKSAEVFSRQTIYTSSQRATELIPPLINVTTSQSDSNIEPYMFAISLTANSFTSLSSFKDSDLRVTVLYSRFHGFKENRTSEDQIIKLQPCTPNHFSKIENIDSNFVSWRLNEFYCLPLNRTFEIGGHPFLSEQYKQISIVVSCATLQCMTAKNKNVLFNTITLNTIVNPSNSTHPFTYTLEDQTFLFQSEMMINYRFLLEHNIVQTDNNVLLSKDVTEQKSYTKQENFHMYGGYDSIPKTFLIISNSGTTQTYTRSFLKFLDAVAFAGGVFQAMLAISFFMGSFGKFYYEMKFAQRYFKCSEAQHINVISFIKQIFYALLSLVNKKPDWENTSQRQRLMNTVNNLLDMVYLQHRIVFLEKAVSIMLERHQLKGLNLIYSLSPDEVDRNFRIHRFRNRLIYFLKKRQEQKEDKDDKEEKNNQLSKEKESTSKQLQTEIKVQNMLVYSQKQLIEQPTSTVFSKFWQAQKNNMGVLNQPLEKMDEDQENDDEILWEIETDLKKLAEDESNIDGDIRSKRICSLIDTQLWKKVKSVIQ